MFTHLYHHSIIKSHWFPFRFSVSFRFFKDQWQALMIHETHIFYLYENRFLSCLTWCRSIWASLYDSIVLSVYSCNGESFLSSVVGSFIQINFISFLINLITAHKYPQQDVCTHIMSSKLCTMRNNIDKWCIRIKRKKMCCFRSVDIKKWQQKKTTQIKTRDRIVYAKHFEHGSWVKKNDWERKCLEKERPE